MPTRRRPQQSAQRARRSGTVAAARCRLVQELCRLAQDRPRRRRGLSEESCSRASSCSSIHQDEERAPSELRAVHYRSPTTTETRRLWGHFMIRRPLRPETTGTPWLPRIAAGVCDEAEAVDAGALTRRRLYAMRCPLCPVYEAFRAAVLGPGSRRARRRQPIRYSPVHGA